MTTPLDIFPGSRYNVIRDNTHYPQICVFDKSDGISKDIMNGVDWEPAVCSTLANVYVPGTDVIDIGANLGLCALGMHRRKKITGTIHLFEPQHDVFTALRYNVRDLPASLYNMAVADEVRVLNFEQVYGNIGGTPLQGEGGAIGSPYALPISGKATKIMALPIDSIEFQNRISTVKIDAEGSELSVLQGARRTLTKHQPAIVIEVWKQNRDAVFAELTNLDYKLVENIKDTFGDDFLWMHK